MTSYMTLHGSMANTFVLRTTSHTNKSTKTRSLDNEMFEKRTRLATVRLHLNQTKKNKGQTCNNACVVWTSALASQSFHGLVVKKGFRIFTQFKAKFELNTLCTFWQC